MRHLIAAAVLALSAAPAAAAPGLSLGDETITSPDGVNEFGLSVGGFKPTGKVGFVQPGNDGDRFGSPGYMFSLGYLRSLNRAIALGLEYDYISRGEYTASDAFVAPTKTFIRGDTSLIMAITRVRWRGQGLRPYLMGGIGVHLSKLHIYGETIGGVPSALYQDHAAGLAWMGRVGVEYTAPTGGFIGFEGGFLGAKREKYNPTSLGVAAGYPAIKVSPEGISYLLRAGVRFGAGS